MNGRHDDSILTHRDDNGDDDDTVDMDVNGHQQMPGRSDSPVLRPLPSMCIYLFCYFTFWFLADRTG